MKTTQTLAQQTNQKKKLLQDKNRTKKPPHTFKKTNKYKM
jgi:hypothetical protein